MATREELREGIGERLAVMDNLIYKRLSPGDKERNDYNTDIILSYLHSQGVVIKVDGETPEVEEDNPFARLDEQAKMLEAGCGFFEPLVEE